MASFPSSIVNLTNPTTANFLNSPSHAAQHGNANDEIEAIEAKVGVDSSAVVTSLDYKVGKLITSAKYAVDSQASDTYVIALAPILTAYTAGQEITFKPNTSNTGAATLNVNSLGAKTIKYHGLDLVDNMIVAGFPARLVYDGTNFELINPSTNQIGYTEITTSFTSTATPAITDVTSLATTVIIPTGGSRVKITLKPTYVKSTAVAGTTVGIYIREGSTALDTSLVDIPISSYATPIVPCIYDAFVTAGSHTYKASISQSAAGTMTFGTAGSTGPTFISVELI